MTAPLLEIRNLSVAFGRGPERRSVVSGISFDVQPGEALGVVGESGSGKSLSMLSVLGLQPPGAAVAAERLAFDGKDLRGLSEDAMSGVRGREIAIVFQDPLSALNPVLTIGRQITEIVRRHFGVSRVEANRRAVELLASVGVPDPPTRLRQYPHQFSGGMRQRTMIAMALAGKPRLLIADEPTTALDVTVQAEIVTMIKRLQAELGMTIIWVTHDLALLTRIASRVLVMYAGTIVESAPIDTLFDDPQHPYTKMLLSNIKGRDFAAPAPKRAPATLPADNAGCPFATRCPEAMARCVAEAPALASGRGGASVACWADGRPG